MKIRPFLVSVALALCTSLLAVVPASASPWAEVGDNQLRSDVELLASVGVIDGVTIHWPLPWQSLVRAIHAADLSGRPPAVRAAADRLLRRAYVENKAGITGSFTADIDSTPSIVYGFDGMSRGRAQSQLSLGGNAGIFSARLSVGAFADQYHRNAIKFMPDGSYLSAKLGDTLIYAGYLDHWWGPGEISALSLSNNARPMPQVGIERASTQASSWPVLNWLGPWQIEFLLGYLDGPRITPNTFYNALHVTVNPLPGLEIGLSRTEEFCGDGHPCSPIRDYFNVNNDPTHVNNTNDQGSIELKYTHVLSGVPVQVYMQLMNEDTSPITSSGTSHLFGSSVFLPVAAVNPLKLTVEYSNSIATMDIFSFSNNIYGFSYTNGGYPDGMRYRGRTLGFSLDDDSTLLSAQGSWTDDAGRFYELSFHHATVGSAHSLGRNILSPTPVHINLGEARVSLPLANTHLKLDVAGRLQDDQLRPASGAEASIEVALKANF